MPALDPQCITGKIAFAVTNRGELIPCCRCDDPPTINDPEFQKLLAVSKINDHNTIQDILNTTEWIQFEENLRNNIGPPACWYTCKSNKSAEDTQEIKLIDTTTNKTKYEQKR